MGIVREVQVQVAVVEVSDDYEVVLRQLRRRVKYSPAEAIALANDLVRAAEGARLALEEDRQAWSDAGHTLAHGFDVAPVCRDCSEGKHGACNGAALVDGALEVAEVPCGCSGAGHTLAGVQA